MGSIYERLLEYTLAQEDSEIVAHPASFARKVSGSYYTHDDLVRLILDEAVGRLADEKIAAFNAQLEEFSSRKSLKPYEWDKLDALDPATAILELKICDPAIGSGHFLVALVDWLASRILESIESVDQRVNKMPWASHLVDKGTPYSSPLVARLADVRLRIKKAGAEHGWALDDRQLDDRHIVQRMILKKVIFGVDKNPMAVELAKVALWLHTFTVGAALSFLDHHLKCGDSLHGEQLAPVRAELIQRGSILDQGSLDALNISARALQEVAELTDTSIAEAHQSKALADEAALAVAPIKSLLSFWRALRWMMPGWPDKKRKAVGKSTDDDMSPMTRGIAEIFKGEYNVALLAQNQFVEGNGAGIEAANQLLSDAMALAERECFFHWWTEFPTVWKNSEPGHGGFDAVIGNPPWDRIKLQEVEWFAERKPAISMQARAADRKALIAKEKQRKSPLWRDYEQATATAESMARVVRESGDFPLLSGGNVNLYSLFVERAQALVRPNGIVGC